MASRPLYSLSVLSSSLLYWLNTFWLSYEKRIIPPEHKEANVVHIHMSGSRNKPKKFRPISLTRLVSEIFEGLIKDDLEEFVESKNTNCDDQHGFCKRMSTCTNLLGYWQVRTDLVDQSYSVSVLYTDFNKAFYSVPRVLIGQKLRLYGMRIFLQNLSQRVIINCVSSSTFEVASGVKQGEVLSSLLISINMYTFLESCFFLNFNVQGRR